MLIEVLCLKNLFTTFYVNFISICPNLPYMCSTVLGLYPLIGWKIGDETTFIAEGMSADTGVCIEWAKQMGKCADL